MIVFWLMNPNNALLIAQFPKIWQEMIIGKHATVVLEAIQIKFRHWVLRIMNINC